MNHLQGQEIPSHPHLKIAFGLIFAGLVLGIVPSALIAQQHSEWVIVFGELLLIVPAFLYLKRKSYNLRSVFRINKVDNRVLYLMLPMGVSITVLSDQIDRIISLFIKMPPEWQELLAQNLTAETPLEWFNLFLGAVVLAGIFEEMLFRGLLQKAFEQKFDLTRAIFLCAFTFAVIHLPFWLIQVLMLGMVLGVISWRSDSTIPTMIIHCLNNSFALFFANSDPENWQWYNWNGHVNPTVLVIASGIIYYTFKWFFAFTKEQSEYSP